MTPKKEITIYDIAEELKLSPSTVSRGLRDHPAIKPSTIKRIKEAASRLGYQENPFARQLRQNRSHTIGVILPVIDSSFQSRVVSGIEMVASQRGYNLLISQSSDSPDKEFDNIRTMFNNRVDGLLFTMASMTPDLSRLDIFLDKHIPVVMFDRVKQHTKHQLVSVVINNRSAGYEATEHLIAQGCRRILYLTDNMDCSVFGERGEGYKSALLAHGLEVDPELIIVDKLNEGTGARTMRKLQAMKEFPDGIFTANDVSGASMICALKKAGIDVPGQVAVTGFNNVYISRVVSPALSTIHYPAVEMGQEAATALIGMLDDPSTADGRTILLEHHHVARASSLRT